MTSRFHILDKLGEGSMGVVYEAYDRERDMHVALKTLRHLDASSLYRFKREFRALADLSHPNLVSLYELIHEDDRWLLTMELVRGVDLMGYLHPTSDFDEDSDVTGTGVHTVAPMTMDTVDLPGDPSPNHGPAAFVSVHEVVDLERVRRVMGDLARGLDALHRAGLVHRDLKPENVRITDEGRVVLMDFGLVIRTARSSVSSGRVPMAGTPAYMAPEQLDRVQPTAAADWYSFGTLLFEALTSHLPFTGLPSDVLHAKRERDAPRLESVVGDVPEELRELCHGLLARDPEARPDGAQVLRQLGVPAEHESSEARGVRCFVGRESELARLRAAYQEVARGAGRCVFVDGPPGIGKTQLVEAFIDQVYRESSDAGAPYVLASWCHERESLLYKALDGVVDDISQLMRMLPDDERNALIPPDMSILSRLFPVLVRVPVAAPSPGQDVRRSGREGRRRALAALRVLLERMAVTRPVVLRIESLQWADEDSMELIGELFGPAPIPGVLALMTARSAARNRSLDEALATLSCHPGFVHLRLGPLAQDEQRRMVERLTAHPRLLAHIHDSQWRAMGGQPLLLIELSRYLDELGSSDLAPSSERAPTLLHVIERHVERIPEDAHTMLEMLAVFGESTPVGVLQEACSLSGERAERAATTLINGMLARVTRVESGLWLDCHHDKIRQVVLHSMPSDKLRALHRWVAHILETRHQTDHATVARHFEAAGAHEDACEHLLLAARDAAEKLATSRAAHLYRHIIARLDSDDASERAARLVCNAHIGLAAGQGMTAQHDKAMAQLARAEELATRHEFIEELSEIHRGRGDLLFPAGQVESCRREHERALEFARRAGSASLELRAQSGLADACYLAGQMRSAYRHYDACIALAREQRSLDDELPNRVMRGFTRYFENQLEAALDDCRGAAERADARGHTRALALARCGMLGVILIDMGRASDALPELQIGLELARTMSAPRFEVHTLMTTGLAFFACGRRVAALAAVEEALALAEVTSMVFSGPWVLAALACVSGDAGRQRELLARARALLDDNRIAHNHLFVHRYAMDVHDALGDLDAVVHHAAELERFAAHEPMPWADLFVARGRVLAERAGGGDVAERIRALAERARQCGFAVMAAELERRAG